MAVRRGEVWTVAGGAYASKPRPAIVIQADGFQGLDSVTLIPCTTNPAEAPLLRPELAASAERGLRADCGAMVDKLTTVPLRNLGTRIGALSDDDMLRIDRALALFLGLG